MPKNVAEVDEKSWTMVLRDVGFETGAGEWGEASEGLGRLTRKRARTRVEDDDADGKARAAMPTVRCGRGLKALDHICKESVFMELAGPSQLITAQACAREPALSPLIKYWLLTQTSQSLGNLVPRELLRYWRREDTLWHHAPWVTDEDCEGEGYAANPTSRYRTLHLPLDDIVLSCFMVLERRKGKESRWFDYINKLPTLDDFEKDVPLMIPLRQFVQMFGYEECQKAHSRQRHSDATLRYMINQRRNLQRTLDLTFLHIVSRVDFKSGTLGNRFTFQRTHMTREEFFWGHAVVMTRAFRSPNAPSGDIWRDLVRRKDFVGAFLAPNLDFANYRTVPNIECTISDGRSGQGKVTARALKDCSKGDFMHMTCNLPQDNVNLFLRHGYCARHYAGEARGETCDTFYVDLDDLIGWFRNTDVIDAHLDTPLQFVRGEVALVALSEMVKCIRTCVYQAVRRTRERLIKSRGADTDATATAASTIVIKEKVAAALIALDDKDLEEIQSLMFDASDVEVLSRPIMRTPAVVSLRHEVEIRALRAVRDWLCRLKCGPMKPCQSVDPSREKLIRAYDVLRSSRQRTFDLYAMTAHIIADQLASSGPNARKSLPVHIKHLMLRRVGDDVFDAAARDLARAYVARLGTE
jgi:hypothetical protein